MGRVGGREVNCRRVRHMRNLMQSMIQLRQPVELNEVMEMFDATPDEVIQSVRNLVRLNSERAYVLDIVEGSTLVARYRIQ